MRRCISLLLCTVAFLVQSFNASADSGDEDPIKVTLHAEETSIQTDKSFQLAVTLDMEKNWHAYWKNPGDAGAPVEIEWELPEGYTVEDIAWPYPKRFDMASMIGYGYEDQVSFITKVTPSTKFSNPSAEIKAKVKWLVCSDSICLPGESLATITLPISPAAPAANAETAAIFTQAHASMPKQQGDFKVHRTEDKIHIHLNTPGEYTTAYFCPEDSAQFDYKAMPELTTTSDDILLAFNDQKGATQLKGVLVLSKGEGDNLLTEAYDIDLPISQDNSVDAPSSEATFEGGFGLALLLAFIGGMILNLMPCVLPVVSFKILSFVKLSGESRVLSIKHGLLFSFGVLLSFWILAGILLILQAYGRSVGWGFQLQEPVFVAILAAIIFIFGLSLFGVFEMGMGVASLAGQKRHSGGLWGSFFSGILATAVATPCTGPFLGSAVGYAVTLPPVWSLLIFTSLGLGMAFPYLVLAMYPQLLRFLPKPGPWMVTFKEIMGFLMMATVIWLLWVFGAQIPMIGFMMLIVSFFIFALGCWAYGRWGTPVNKRSARTISFIFLALCLLFGGQLLWTASTLPGEEATDTAIADVSQAKSLVAYDVWEPYSPQRVKELHAKGIPVFVDFTAKWCLICQANHLVLSTPEVAKKLREVGVVKMKADWTRKDALIAKELRKFGRSGVPLYLLYDKNPSSEPYVLPQVLTPDFVLKLLNEIERQPIIVTTPPEDTTTTERTKRT